MQEYYQKPGVLLNEILSEDPDENLQQDFDIMQKFVIGLTKEILDAQGIYNQKVDFIGAHPISLMKRHFQEIIKNQENWLVCEKTDGVRYLMIILSNGHVYLTGRNVGGLLQAVKQYQFFRVNVKLPKLLYQDQFPKVEEIFDGELVVDEFHDKENNKYEYMHYLIFDTLVHNGNQKVHSKQHCFPYFERLRCAEEYIELLQTAKSLQKETLEIDFPAIKFFPKIRLLLKDFFQISQLRYVINHYFLTLLHDNDGLIFTQNNAYYRPGTCEAIRKWKPPHKNSIDFLIVPNKEIELSNPNEGLLELYLMSRYDDETILIFFDFKLTTSAEVEQIKDQINQLCENQQQNNLQAVKGVVAECYLVKAQSNQDSLKKLLQPETFGCASDQVDQFLTELIKLTTHFSKSYFQSHDNFKKDQLTILKQVREMIHLKDNFKSCWKIDRFRTDKSSPNSTKVGMNIIEILNEVIFQINNKQLNLKNLTSEDLLAILQSVNK